MSHDRLRVDRCRSSETTTTDRAVSFAIEYVLTILLVISLVAAVGVIAVDEITAAERTVVETEADRIAEETAVAIDAAESILTRVGPSSSDRPPEAPIEIRLTPSLPSSVGSMPYSIDVEGDQRVVLVSVRTGSEGSIEGRAVYTADTMVRVDRTVTNGELEIRYDDDTEEFVVDRSDY